MIVRRCRIWDERHGAYWLQMNPGPSGAKGWTERPEEAGTWTEAEAVAIQESAAFMGLAIRLEWLDPEPVMATDDMEVVCVLPDGHELLRKRVPQMGTYVYYTTAIAGMMVCDFTVMDPGTLLAAIVEEQRRQFLVRNGLRIEPPLEDIPEMDTEGLE